jgi:hypothetical protein
MSDDDKYLAGAREWFRLVSEHEGTMRSLMLDDIKFVRLGGEYQWPQGALAARKQPGRERPVLTDNRLRRYRTQVINNIRANRPSIKVRPVDDRADKKTAAILQGVIRNICAFSRADYAVDKAVEFSVDCGRGFFALRTGYVRPDAFEQDIMFRMLPDSFKVYFDPWSSEPDGSDAKRAMLIEDVPRKQFEEDEPDTPIADWEEGAGGDADWLSKDSIRLAEDYQLVTEPAELLLTEDGRAIWADMLQPGDIVVAARKSQRTRCHWHKVAGNQVIATAVMPTQYIPVIPIYGDESWIDGERHISGLVRSGKDPQRMLNFWLSAASEQIALQPKVPFIGPEGAFDGHESKWATANTVNHAYLTYRSHDESGNPLNKPERDAPPPIPSGYIEQMNIAIDGIRAAVGMEDPSIGAGQGPNQSGRAIRSLMEQGSIGTSHYQDNAAKSLTHAGRIILEMIPSVYETRRTLRILGEDDMPSQAEHDPALPESVREMKNEAGEVRKIYNLGVGQYDCIATPGPSYATRRQEGADAMLSLTQALPQAGQVAGDLIVRMLDTPYADDIADRMRAALPPQIAAATETEDADPKLSQAQAMIQALHQQIQALSDERDFKAAEMQLKAREVAVKEFTAETDRMAKLKPEFEGHGDDSMEQDERITRLLLDVEKGQREQEQHDKAMRELQPLPSPNPLLGPGPIN